MKSKILTIAMALSLGAMAVNAQMIPGNKGGLERNLDRLEAPAEVVALQSELRTLRDELRASRDAVLEALGEDATTEDRIAAIQDWQTENEIDLETVRELANDLRSALEEYRPERPDAPGMNPEVIALRENLETLRTTLQESRDAALAVLGEDATEEEIETAIAEWREANADQIAAVESARDELKTWFKENRPDRPGRGISAKMKERQAAFRAQAMQLKEARQALREQLSNPDLTEEERQAIIEEHREEHRTMMQEIKELRRNQRRGGDNTGGDRRPEG